MRGSGDAHGQLEVDLGVDDDVAVAVQVLDHRYARLGGDALDQALAAARDDHVDELRHRDQRAHRGAVGGRHQLHGVFRQAGLGQRRAHQRGQRAVAVHGLGAAAQDAGVAALDGQARGLDGDVGPALVDHAEHPQRHAHAAHGDAARAALHAGDLAHRVGHRGDLLAAFGQRGDDGVGQAQAVEQRPGQAGGTRRGEVALVGLGQCGAGAAQAARQRQQRGIARRRRRGGHGRGSGAGGGAQGRHQRRDIVVRIHGTHCLSPGRRRPRPRHAAGLRPWPPSWRAPSSPPPACARAAARTRSRPCRPWRPTPGRP